MYRPVLLLDISLINSCSKQVKFYMLKINSDDGGVFSGKGVVG